MATIRKRGTRWQAQVRLQGHPAISRSFLLKADAEAWGRQKEVEIERGELLNASRSVKAYSLSTLLTRYESEVTSRKRGASSERYRLKTIQASTITGLPLDKLTPSLLAAYRDERLKVVSAPSVRRELAIIQHCLEIARREWGVRLTRNPMEMVSKPAQAKARTRRVTDDDAAKLAEGLLRTRNRLLADVIRFAIATGMRRGELLAMCWRDFDVANKVAYLPLTKNGESRMVPLSPEALSIILRQTKEEGEDRIFPLSPNALRLAWERLKRRSKVEDLRFHDLRHEAISRFFELGLSVPEVSLISGHKDTKMLFRYTHLKPTKVAEKLEQLAKGQL